MAFPSAAAAAGAGIDGEAQGPPAPAENLRQAPDLQGFGAFGRVGVCRWRSSAVERLICNQRVGGSIPSASSIAKANPGSASHGGCSGRRTGGFLWGGSEAAKRIRL